MSTINISINGSDLQHEATTQPKANATEELTPSSGGSAPGSETSTTMESSAALSGNGLVDIGSPPAWLHEAIAADKATLAPDSELNGINTDGGAGPID